MTREGERTSHQNGRLRSRLTLQAVALTLLGVLASIGVTVASAIGPAWWVRVATGAATTVGLAVAVALLGTRTEVLARLADWITGRSYRGSDGDDIAR